MCGFGLEMELGVAEGNANENKSISWGGMRGGIFIDCQQHEKEDCP